MSGDNLGEITVSVAAEGTEQAAEAAQQAAEDTGGGGGGGNSGDGGLGTAIRGGIIGGLLSEALGPILDLLDPILAILQAFVVPFALIGLRLLSPVLRSMLRLIPPLLAFARDPKGAFKDALQFIFDKLTQLPGLIWDFLQDLPGLIWSAVGVAADLVKTIADGVAGLAKAFAKEVAELLESEESETVREQGTPSGIGSGIASDFARLLQQANSATGSTAGAAGVDATLPDVNIDFSGGLSEFLESTSSDSTYNLNR